MRLVPFLLVVALSASPQINAGDLAQCRDLQARWLAAAAAGRSAEAIDLARTLEAQIDDETLRTVPTTAAFRMAPYFALTRFGRWQEMLDEPDPPEFNLVLLAAWHYARGRADAALDQLAQAEAELGVLRLLLQDQVMEQPLLSSNSAGSVLAPAPEILAAEIAARKKAAAAAVAHLERAVRLYDALGPPEFPEPPRPLLDAILK